MADFPEAELLQGLGRSALDRLSAWEGKVVQVEYETYEDEDNLPPKLVKQVRHLLDVIDGAGPPIAAGALERMGDLKGDWIDLQDELREISTSDIAALNNWARANTIPHISNPVQ